MTLHAGPFSLQYHNGFIRYLRYGEDEIIRMLYFALRDENWATLESRIENEKIIQSDRGFEITYIRYNYIGETGLFKWNVKINGARDGEITFDISGECLESIKKNRAGFCILHPVKETRGQPCTITHPDGSETPSAFPDTIDPLNPFLQIQAMTWRSGAAHFQLEFSGDVFETEDQRNWTDASFKTFCTPLNIPFPVQLVKGDKIHQRVTFRPTASLPVQPDLDEHVVSISIQPAHTYILPRIGLGSSTELNELTREAILKLKQLKADHYRVEVYPSRDYWVKQWMSDIQVARALEISVEVVIYVTSNFIQELLTFCEQCNANAIVPKNLFVLSEGSLTTDQRVIDHLPTLKKHLPTTSLGAGTAYNFTELNRNRFNAAPVEFVAYSIHPQEHAFDDASLIENIAAQGDTITSAKLIYPGKEIYVSPVVLKKRFNPYSADPGSRLLSEEQKADPRQTRPFNGPWALGSIKSLAQSGAASVSYFQTVGNQGVVDAVGKPFPVWQALSMLLQYKDELLTASTSNRPLIADALVFRRSTGYLAILFNYTGENQTVRVGNNNVQLSPYSVQEVTL